MAFCMSWQKRKTFLSLARIQIFVVEEAFFCRERLFSCCSVRSRGFCIPYIQFRWGTKGRRVRSVPSSVSSILYVWQLHVIIWRVGVNAVFCVIFTLYCYYYRYYIILYKKTLRPSPPSHFFEQKNVSMTGMLASVYNNIIIIYVLISVRTRFEVTCLIVSRLSPFHLPREHCRGRRRAMRSACLSSLLKYL